MDIKERCPHCGNMVLGQLQRSTGSKFARTLLKKGGMKGTLAAVGSVVPGIGTITGLAIGTGIDVFYGDKIKKVIDEGVDAFVEDTLYKFKCPNCEEEWVKKTTQGRYEYENLIRGYEEEIESEYDEIYPKELDQESLEEEKFLTKNDNSISQSKKVIKKITKRTSDFNLSAWTDRQLWILMHMDPDDREEYGNIALEQLKRIDSPDRPIVKRQIERLQGFVPSYWSGKLENATSVEKFNLDSDKEDVNKNDTKSDNSNVKANEQEYINEYKEIISEGEMSERDRRFLNKIMKANGISEERAKELEEMCKVHELNEGEQEYLNEYQEMISEGEISERDRRFLNKILVSNGISQERASELEKMAQ